MFGVCPEYIPLLVSVSVAIASRRKHSSNENVVDIVMCLFCAYSQSSMANKIDHTTFSLRE